MKVEPRKGPAGSAERAAQVMADALERAGYEVDQVRAPHGVALGTTDPHTKEELQIFVGVLDL